MLLVKANSTPAPSIPPHRQCLFLDAVGPETIKRNAGGGDPVPLVGPGHAALHVQHGAVDGAAEPHGKAAERVDIGLAGGVYPVKEGTSVAAANAGPAGLGLEAPHPRSALEVVTDLATTQESVDAVVVDRRVRKKVVVGTPALPAKKYSARILTTPSSPRAPPTWTPT